MPEIKVKLLRKFQLNDKRKKNERESEASST